jgi:hypothetical protein
VALLLLLGVKLIFLGFYMVYKNLDPIKCQPIIDPGRQAFVMCDRGVEFNTLVTHFQFRICANLGVTLIVALEVIRRLQLVTDLPFLQLPLGLDPEVFLFAVRLSNQHPEFMNSGADIFRIYHSSLL